MVGGGEDAAGGHWHRPTHAFVALAKRAPERSALSMEAFVTHPSWWVRMYAARAAAAAEDVTRLDKLAYDANDNVREAALGPLRRLKKGDADAAIVAALDRTDVQLLRTAATLLKDFTPSGRLARPLLAALQRLTKEGKETSRDARLPLLEAIAVHARPDDALDLQPLLKDFDPRSRPRPRRRDATDRQGHRRRSSPRSGAGRWRSRTFGNASPSACRPASRSGCA